MKRLWILLVVAAALTGSLGCRRMALFNRGARCEVCPPCPGAPYSAPYVAPPTIAPGGEYVTPSPETYVPSLP